MEQSETNERKTAIAVFEGYSVTSDLRFKNNMGQEVDPWRFSYEKSWDVLIPAGKKIMDLDIDDESQNPTLFWLFVKIEQLSISDSLQEWFKTISDFCMEWHKQNKKNA